MLLLQSKLVRIKVDLGAPMEFEGAQMYFALSMNSVVTKGTGIGISFWIHEMQLLKNWIYEMQLIVFQLYTSILSSSNVGSVFCWCI